MAFAVTLSTPKKQTHDCYGLKVDLLRVSQDNYHLMCHKMRLCVTQAVAN